MPKKEMILDELKDVNGGISQFSGSQYRIGQLFEGTLDSVRATIKIVGFAEEGKYKIAITRFDNKRFVNKVVSEAELTGLIK